MSETDPILELDALLDPVRLAAAWQIARERSPVAVADADGAAAGSDDGDPDPDPEATEVEPTGAVAADEPARAAPLPVALAHRQLLDEIERTWASPATAARARRVLSAPLAQLAQATDPVDLAAAEAALDQLEDVLQALLSEAGWPESPARDED